MIGISKELAADLAARGYSDADVAQLFDPRAHKGKLRVIYRRHPTSDDFTSPLPSSRHMAYVAKNWTAVAIVDPPSAMEEPEISVSAEILAYGAQDRVGIWNRNRDQIEVSCRNARSLLARGWTFAGLVDEERRRAVAEARPVPSKSAGAAKSK